MIEQEKNDEITKEKNKLKIMKRRQSERIQLE